MRRVLQHTQGGDVAVVVVIVTNENRVDARQVR